MRDASTSGSTSGALAGFALLVAGSASAGGGPSWTEDPIPFPRARDSAAFAFDLATGEGVLFGGNNPLPPIQLSDTYVYDGTSWTEVFPLVSPGKRLQSAAASNPTGGVLLFGGLDSGVGGPTYGDTWVYANGAWTEFFPLVSPPARYGHAMCFDPVSEKVYLFGGFASDYLGDAWCWDGVTWSPVASVISPPPRTNPQMACRPGGASPEIVLFGGFNFFQGGQMFDTWVYNGVEWIQQIPATSPPQRSSAAMTNDRNGDVLLFGGQPSTGTDIGDTWRWNGTTWTPVVANPAPRARAASAVGYDPLRQEVVLFAGRARDGASTDYLDDTWVWDGSAWAEGAIAKRPPRRSQVGMVYDVAREEVLLFGGWDHTQNLDDTWIFKNGTWTLRDVAPFPVERSLPAIAYDAANENVILFGGSRGGIRLGDTWTWDGAAWTQLTPPTSPDPLYAPATFYDPSRGDVVFFGGSYATGVSNETWSWDGATWTELAPPSAPPARQRASAAWDPVNGNALLFGGFGTGGLLFGDTWTWDGSTWTEHVVPGPAARYGVGLAFDPASNTVLLFGGTVGGGPEGDLSETWSWDGASWSQLFPSGDPIGRHSPALVPSDATGRLLLFGGSSLVQSSLRDAWFWEAGGPVAVGENLAPGAASIAGVRAWPNPARARIALATQLPGRGPFSLHVFDAAGRRLLTGVRDSGEGRVRVDLDTHALGLGPGVYFVRLEREGRSASGRFGVVE